MIVEPVFTGPPPSSPFRLTQSALSPSAPTSARSNRRGFATPGHAFAKPKRGASCLTHLLLRAKIAIPSTFRRHGETGTLPAWKLDQHDA